MADLIQVRTTMRPWEPFEVDQTEYEHLLNEGLVLPGTEQQEIAEAAATAAQTPQTGPRARGTAKKEDS